MTYPIKKLPHTINNYDLYPIIETVNQIIDHIQPIEAPTEEIEKYEGHLGYHKDTNLYHPLYPDWVVKKCGNAPYGVEEDYYHITHLLRPSYSVSKGNFTEKELLSLGYKYKCEAPTEEVKGDWIDSLYHELDRRQGIKMSPIFFKQLLKQFMPKPVEQELIPLDNIDKVIEELKLCFGIDYMPESHLEPTYDTKSMKAILSKYGVHKQEEKVQVMEDNTKTMDLKCSKGTKVRLITNASGICNGYDSDKKWCEQHLDVNTYYTVHKVNIEAWSSSVELEEKPGLRFNTVCFYEGQPTPTPQATSVDDLVHKIYVKLYNAGLKLDDTKQQFIKEVLLSSLPIQKKRTDNEIYDFFCSGSKGAYLNGHEKSKGVIIFLKHIGLLQD